MVYVCKISLFKIDKKYYFIYRFLKPFIGMGFTVNTLVTCITRILNFLYIEIIKLTIIPYASSWTKCFENLSFDVIKIKGDERRSGRENPSKEMDDLSFLRHHKADFLRHFVQLPICIA